MDLKKKFGVSELKTEYAYSQKIKAQLNNGVEDRLAFPLLWRIIDYTEYLHKTKLTPELVEKLFKGIRQSESKDDLIENRLWIKGQIGIDFYYPYSFNGETIIKIEAYTLKSNGWQTDKQGFIQTLADLARLTAAKPILLA